MLADHILTLCSRHNSCLHSFGGCTNAVICTRIMTSFKSIIPHLFNCSAVCSEVFWLVPQFNFNINSVHSLSLGSDYTVYFLLWTWHWVVILYFRSPEGRGWNNQKKGVRTGLYPVMFIKKDISRVIQCLKIFSNLTCIYFFVTIFILGSP